MVFGLGMISCPNAQDVSVDFMQRLGEINPHFLLSFPTWDGINVTLLVAMLPASCQWRKPVGSKNK